MMKNPDYFQSEAAKRQSKNVWDETKTPKKWFKNQKGEKKQDNL